MPSAHRCVSASAAGDQRDASVSGPAHSSRPAAASAKSGALTKKRSGTLSAGE